MTGTLRLLASCLAIAAILSSPDAQAQNYPARPIRVILAIGVGGVQDSFTRTLSEKMLPTLGQPLVVENRPGAGGNIAMESVARAPADGYTLLIIGPNLVINPFLYKKMSFDPMKELVPIAGIAYGPYAVIINSAVPVNNLAEFIAYAKARPGQINFASVGNGTGGHLTGVLFTLAAGVDMQHVPYKSIQQVVPDLVSGQVQVVFNAYTTFVPLLQEGKLKMLGFTSARRFSQYPNIQTLAEAGLPGFDSIGWYLLYAPAGTPKDVLTRLSAELLRALNQRDVIDSFGKLTLETMPLTMEETARFAAREAEKWGRAVKASGATAE